MSIGARGMDPYELGPAQALGVDHTLTRTVPNIWRETPAPYEPLFLWIGKWIGTVTGDNIVAGVLVHRAVELIGLALIVWALPRLARRCGVAPVAALRGIEELHIGHAIVSRAVFCGLRDAVAEMKRIMVEAAG